jgi:hypothetical protein
VKLQADDLFQTPLDQAEIDFENEGGETYICGNPPYLRDGLVLEGAPVHGETDGESCVCCHELNLPRTACTHVLAHDAQHIVAHLLRLLIVQVAQSRNSQCWRHCSDHRPNNRSREERAAIRGSGHR